jgi:hypothetical protein
MRFTDKEKLNSYPPTKEQFLNAWKDMEKLDDIKKLIKKVKDNPKENPCNAWFIHSLEIILTNNKKGD